MIVAYTIGHTKSYLQAIEEAKLNKTNTFKIGKNSSSLKEPYDGGWVWKTPEEAKIFLNSEEFLLIDWGDNIPRPAHKFSVFRLSLPNGWGIDTYFNSKTNSFNLLNDAIIEGCVDGCVS